MAKFDIMPFNAGSFGGTREVRYGQMTASEVFETGEPIGVVAAGTLTEPTDDTAEITLAQAASGNEFGIACFGPGAGNINPVTGVAFADLDDVAYWPVGPGQLFITDNVFTASAAALTDPAQTDVGNFYEIAYSTAAGNRGGAGWGVVTATDATAGSDLGAKIVEVLDSRKDPIRVSGNTGEYVVFEILVGTV